VSNGLYLRVIRLISVDEWMTSLVLIANGQHFVVYFDDVEPTERMTTAHYFPIAGCQL